MTPNSLHLGLILSLASSAACSRSRPPTAEPATVTGQSAVGTPPEPAAVGNGPGATDLAAPPPAVASGPRAALTGDHYALTAALGAPPTVPGAASLSVEIRATGGYHVNELYPVNLRLQASNATAPAELRRADVAELTREVAAFRVPVQVTAAGATVRGTYRFAVCSESNCVPQEREFAVALP